MSEFPLITIVTVTYNAANVLEKTILSILSQEYGRMEIVLIDGGSNDGTLEIIRKYEKQIAFWVSQPDGGIYDAMNKGISKATGEWINFMNAGDSFAGPQVLAKLFHRGVVSQIGIIYGDTIVSTKIVQKYAKCVTPFFLSKKYIHGKGICHQSTFVRSQLARQYPFDLTFKICADFKMFYDIYSAGFSFLYQPFAVSIYEVESGYSKQRKMLAFKEDARILKRDRSVKFRLLYILFVLETKLHQILSAFVKKLFPSLFNYIKRARL